MAGLQYPRGPDGKFKSPYRDLTRRELELKLKEFYYNKAFDPREPTLNQLTAAEKLQHWEFGKPVQMTVAVPAPPTLPAEALRNASVETLAVLRDALAQAEAEAIEGETIDHDG